MSDVLGFLMAIGILAAYFGLQKLCEWGVRRDMEAHERELLGTMTPGGSGAAALGCSCPIADNCHGLGYRHKRRTFLVAIGCVVHGAAASDWRGTP